MVLVVMDAVSAVIAVGEELAVPFKDPENDEKIPDVGPKPEGTSSNVAVLGMYLNDGCDFNVSYA